MNICSPIIRSLRSKSHQGGLTGSTATWMHARRCSTEEEIVIPARIPRGPTDVLEALASTVGRDPTAAHYKFHDDPFLTPLSNVQKRVYAMAQESGRKTAHWLKQEHSEHFVYTTWDPPMKMKTLYKNAAPFIDAYSPKAVYDETSEVTEEDLRLVMKSSLINDAKTIYSILESKNIPISDESRQHLLELICYFNEDEPLCEDWIEEKWYRMSNTDQGQRRVMWKDGRMAQSLFDKIENKTSEAFCALIQGMSRFNQMEKAYNLYKECLEKDIPLSTGVYNGMLKSVGFLKEQYEMQWQLILELLNDMNSKNLKPDLETLNSILESLSMMATLVSKEKALKVYAELVNKCKIKPSLATWYHMLNIFCKDRGPKCDILYSIMNLISDTTLEIRDPKDVYFFTTAMNVCRNQLHDVELAKRIHKLLLHDNNYNLIGDSYRESVYYRNYFVLHCRHESLDVLMDLYTQFVPHVYCLEPKVMEEVIRAIDTNAAVEHLPLIWSHIVMFGHTSRLPILQLILDTMINHLPSTDSESVETATLDTPKTIDDVKTLAEAVALEMNSIRQHYEKTTTPVISTENTFADIAWDLYNKVEDQSQNSTNKLCWTAPMLGNIMVILSRAGRLEEAYTVLRKLQKDTTVTGTLDSPDQVTEFSKLAIKEKRPSYVVAATNYLSDNGFVESSTIAKEALQMMLNRTAEEIEGVIADIVSSKTKLVSEDQNITALYSIAAQISQPGSSKGKSSSSADAASSSSSTSSDESSDDEHEQLVKDDSSNSEKK